jgi:hypothetical protein
MVVEICVQENQNKKKEWNKLSKERKEFVTTYSRFYPHLNDAENFGNISISTEMSCSSSSSSLLLNTSTRPSPFSSYSLIPLKLLHLFVPNTRLHPYQRENIFNKQTEEDVEEYRKIDVDENIIDDVSGFGFDKLRTEGVYSSVMGVLSLLCFTFFFYYVFRLVLLHSVVTILYLYKCVYICIRM